jgi:polyhydroxyalkanoate synthesis regulator phasin
VEVVPDILSVLKTEQEKADTLQMEQERNLQKIMEQNTMQRSSVHSTIEEAIKRLEPPVGGIRRGRSLLLQ